MNSNDPEVPFAFWLDPATGVRVSYALPLFHDIDFEVNEGYRRIPHGGVEVGGLLYGTIEAKSLRIEAFRPIECEHSSGPSFHLSDKDLVNLSDSILNAPKDEGLQGLIPVGWFIAHTRSGLELTERERELFQRFFPEPLRLTMLVKPERYKPTRFAFLLRDTSGKSNTDGEQSAIILPLPGRAGKSAPAMPAIPAPKPDVSVPALVEPVPIKADNVEPESQVTPPPPVVPGPVQVPVVPRTAAVQSSIPAPGLGKRSRSGWLSAVLLIAALLGCGVGYWAYLQLPPAVISLRIQRQAGTLVVIWDPAQTQSSKYAVIRTNDGRPVLLTDEQRASGLAQVPLAGETIKIEIIAPNWGRESRGIIRYVAGGAL